MAFVLLHGLGGDRNDPLSLLTPVLPDGAVVHAPDARAHGASTLLGSPADFTLDALAADLVPGLPPGPLTIIGISMGAAIALRLAVRGDLDIERLVFIRPAFTWERSPDNLAAFPVMGRLLADRGAARAEKEFRTTAEYRAIADVSKLGGVGALQQFRAPDAAKRAIRLVEIPKNAAFASTTELAGITALAAIVAAPRDPVHPLGVAELWQSVIPGATLEVVPARDDDLAAYVAGIRSAVASAISG